MKIHSMVACVGLAFAAVTFAADAPAPSPQIVAARAEVGKSCEMEVKMMCQGKEGREAMACLNTMPDHLGASCKTAMDKLMKLYSAAKPPAK
jgi:hypothetical protein